MILFYFVKILWVSVFLIEGSKLIYNIKKINDAKIEFDLISILEISTSLGLSIVLLGSKGSEGSMWFVSAVLLLMTVVTYFEFKRLIITGADELIIRNNCIKKSEITGYKVFYTSFYLYLNKDKIRVVTPLSSRRKMNILVEEVQKVS